MQSGTFSANSSAKGYTLHENSGDRNYTLEITFEKPFDKKPKIFLSVTKLDAAAKSNLRYSLEAKSISRDGFTVKISAWSDSKIIGIYGNWLAHAE